VARPDGLSQALDSSPLITVVGIGPAGPDHLSIATRTVLATATRGFLRTRRHPAAIVLAGVESFDHHYEDSQTFDEVYSKIVEDLVREAQEAAASGGHVVYGVPGSPLVAERTVELLRADPRVRLQVIPSISFLDLAWERLGVDPLSAGVRLVDGTRFADEAAGERGPFLVAQCWSKDVLSGIKLAADPDAGASLPPVTVLHHLGLDDERVEQVEWWDIDRMIEPDQLTSVWIPTLGDPVSSDVARLQDLVRTLRVECPWDREQTHASLAAHLLEEAYEVIDAIDALNRADASGDAAAQAAATTDLREELGDLLVQVVFHACLAEERGRFTLGDVAAGVHDKLVARHPHVFGDVTATTPDQVADNWEHLKREEKGRQSVTEGIPDALPSLVLATKLQGKAEAIGANLPDFAHGRDWLVGAIGHLTEPVGPPDNGAAAVHDIDEPGDRRMGAMLFGLADLARRLGVDAEHSLRATALAFRERIVEVERQKVTST
jgi:tetrapyrrole methylase family protein/MazG family protein